MKKTILLSAMVLAALGAQAQEKENQPKRGTFSFTPQVGVTWAKQTNVAAYKATEAAGFSATGYEPDARYNAGFTGGLEVGHHRLGLLPGTVLHPGGIQIQRLRGEDLC